MLDCNSFKKIIFSAHNFIIREFSNNRMYYGGDNHGTIVLLFLSVRYHSNHVVLGSMSKSVLRRVWNYNT